MYLNTKLEEFDGSINVAFIGCGKFISMFLSQYNHLKKIKIDTIVDLKIEQAKKNCLDSGLSENTINKINFIIFCQTSIWQTFNRSKITMSYIFLTFKSSNMIAYRT